MKEIQAYQLGSIARWRQKLASHASLTDHVGEKLTGSSLQEFVDSLHQLLPAGIPRDLVFDSVRYLAGSVLTADELEDLAWRFAGNFRRLRNLRPILPWMGQPDEEWVPVQVISGEHYRTKRSGKTGMVFQFQTLAGRPCPLEMSQFWTTRACRVLASRLGFTRQWGPRPFTSVTEFMNLRMYVLVDPVSCRDGKPGFSQVHEEQPAGILTYNRNLLQCRLRTTKDFKCPKDYPPRHRCFQCHVGLEECPAATHERSFVHQECNICKRKNWHDPEHMRMCVDCRVTRILHPKEEP